MVVSKDLVQHDVDLTAFGRPMGLIPGSESIEFKADKNLIDIAYESAVKVLFVLVDKVLAKTKLKLEE